MDLRLTDQQHALREEAASFASGLRATLEADPEWRRQGMLSDGDSREVTRALGEAGWIGMTWPEELGGRGLTHVDTALVEDVFGYHWLPLSLYLLSYKTIGSALERFASPALKEQLLGPIARGELTFCQGFSEPEAGSDLASLTTRAVRRDDRWIVDGHKIWTSSAWLADWIYLAVRTNPDEPRHRGVSVLVAPLDTPGIEVRRFPVLGGGFLCEVFLDGVEIPAENLVGDVDRGWDVLMHTLDFERITAEKLGGLAWILDELEARLRETERLDGAWPACRCAAWRACCRATAVAPRSRRSRPPRACERRVRDGQARGRATRAAPGARGHRASRPRGPHRCATRPRPWKGGSAGSTARRSARRSPAAPRRSSRSSSRGAGWG